MSERLERMEGSTDVETLRRVVRSGLGDGDFTLLYIWTKFWSYGGRASTTAMEAFLHGRQTLSDNDALVLGSVLDELRCLTKGCAVQGPGSECWVKEGLGHGGRLSVGMCDCASLV